MEPECSLPFSQQLAIEPDGHQCTTSHLLPLDPFQYYPAIQIFYFSLSASCLCFLHYSLVYFLRFVFQGHKNIRNIAAEYSR